MARISPEAIVAAVRQYEAMSFEQKQAMGDVLYREQPVLLGSVLAQHRLGVPMDKIDFLLRLLTICFLAMQASGGQWPTITEDHQEAQFDRLLQTLPLHMDPNSPKAQAARNR